MSFVFNDVVGVGSCKLSFHDVSLKGVDDSLVVGDGKESLLKVEVKTSMSAVKSGVEA